MKDATFEETKQKWKSYYGSLVGDKGVQKLQREFDRTTYIHSWFNSIRVIEERTAMQDGAKVMDAGCGWGRMLIGLLDRYTDLDVTALDLQADALDLGRKLIGEERNGSRIQWVEGNLEAIEQRDDTFDAVYSARVFQHLSLPQEGVAQIVRVLKPGGRFLIFLQNRLCPLNIGYYSRLYSPRQVRSWFGGTPVRELHVASMDFFPSRLGRLLPLGVRMTIERTAERTPGLNLLGGKVVAWGVK